jgi:hypothetical protein
VPPELADLDDFDIVIVAAQEAFHADRPEPSPKTGRWIQAKAKMAEVSSS